MKSCAERQKYFRVSDSGFKKDFSEPRNPDSEYRRAAGFGFVGLGKLKPFGMNTCTLARSNACTLE
jgi:hypothetical protein